MIAAALALALLALVLAWPAPLLLARARWPLRAPASALALWQAIALAGALAMIGALLVFGLTPYGNDLVRGSLAFVENLVAGSVAEGATFVHLFSISAAAMLGGHLLLNLAITVAQVERARRRHGDLLALLSQPHPDRPMTRMLDVDAPIAYCLPGTVRSITVLSNGLVSRLSAPQLRGVVEHERTHARQRHHLVLIAFRAWRAALPWLPTASLAYRAVALLVELLADDRARAVVTDAQLQGSIELVATGHLFGQAEQPDPASSMSAWTTTARIERLRTGDSRLSGGAQCAVLAVAAALLAVPTLLLALPVFS